MRKLLLMAVLLALLAACDDSYDGPPQYGDYTVTFDGNGGTLSFSEAETENGGYVLTWPTGTREGYTFYGWSTDREGLNSYFGDRIYEDTTLYAQWTEIQVQPSDPIYITFWGVQNAADQTALEAIELEEAGPVTLPADPEPADPNRHFFGGWYTDAAYTTEFVSGTSVSENTIIHIKWINRYTVTFRDSSTVGVGRVIEVYTNIEGKLESADIPAAPATEEADDEFYGKYFEGWQNPYDLTEDFDLDRVYDDDATYQANLSSLHFEYSIDETNNIAILEGVHPTLTTLGSGVAFQPVRDEYYGYPVTKIADYAFHVNDIPDSSSLGTLLLPSTLEEIGTGAFEYAGLHLRHIDLSGCTSLTTIGARAFAGFTHIGSGNNVHLETFGVIPESVTYIGEDAFYYGNGISVGQVGSEILDAAVVQFSHDSDPGTFDANWDRVFSGSLNVQWGQ